jgi:microcystin-dependent protein
LKLKEINMKKISDFNNATEKYPVVYAGSATRPEYVDMPTTLQQQEGVAPMDTLPAQWWNAMWKLATKDINAFRDFVGDAFTEINNLLTKFNITLDDADSEQLYDFFHDDYVQDYLGPIFVHKNGDTIDGDLHIKGDLSVDGIGEEIISTELKVGANTITLRNDNPTALGNTELAGVVTENYDGSNHNNIISVDKNGVARTGDIDIATRILYSNDGTNFFTDEDLTVPAVIGTGEEVRDTGNQTSGGVEIYEGITYSNDDTQAIATREDNPVDGALMKWDAATKKLISAGAQLSTIVEASSATITGPVLSNSGIVTVLFTANLSANDSTTGLVITYNGNAINVMVSKEGVPSPFTAANIGWGKSSAVYRYLDAYTTLNLYYNGTNLIILDNPIVLKNEAYSATLSQYSIHADGSVDDGKIGDVKPRGIETLPYGWLECNGDEISRTEYAKLFDYFSNETYDNDITHTLLSRYGVGNSVDTFNLPDYQEVALVGAGTNVTDKTAGTLATDDIYTVGEFKDDQLQSHTHQFNVGPAGNLAGMFVTGAYVSSQTSIWSATDARVGSNTRTKEKGVKFIIKVL